MFDWLYPLLGTLLYWFSCVMGNSYALALVLYALVFKLVFLPFAIKQQKNQIKMANLTPKIELIKAKYRGRTDRVTMQKMQQEIMELQQKEGASMFGGCLPLLIQLPIIIFLYQIIRNPLSYICNFGEDRFVTLKSMFYAKTGTNAVWESCIRNGTRDEIAIIGKAQELGIGSTAGEAATLDMITDGRGLPDLSLFGINLGYTPSEAFSGAVIWVIIFIPIIAAALQWLTMFLTKRWNGNANQVAVADGQTNASMKIMDLLFPLMTLWMAFTFSALMGLYWIFQSVLSIIQIFILSRLMPLPKFTEEQLKQMRKEQKAVEKAQRAALKNQKYKSLHYIDEDDYDELMDVKTNEKSSGSTTIDKSNLPDIKD